MSINKATNKDMSIDKAADRDVFINKATNKDISINKATYKHIILLLGYAIFCAFSKPAFISGDVVFYLLLV